MWLAAFRARTPPQERNREQAAALPATRVPELLDAFGDALREQCLTRTELAQALEQRLGSWVTTQRFPAFGGSLPAWQLGLATAAYEGVLAFGPPRGNQVTYQRLEPRPSADPDQALMEVMRRYLRAYGPATDAEFARWFLTSPAAARAIRQRLGAEVQAVNVEGHVAWQLGENDTTPTTKRSVHLLPQFDVYVVGCHPRARLMPDAVPDVLRKMGTAAPWPVVLVDGVVGGLWSRQRRGKRLEVRVDPFIGLTRAQKAAAEAQAERIAHILDAQLDFAFERVEPKAHL